MKSEYIQITENNINSYISEYNFKDKNFSLEDFKDGLKKIIGYTPGVKLKQTEQIKVNEILKKAGQENHTTKIDKIDEIKIVLTDDDKIIELKFII